MEPVFYKRTSFLVMLAPMLGALIGWLLLIVSFALEETSKPQFRGAVNTLYILATVPFWMYSIGGPLAFGAIGFYLTFGYRILGIFSQLSGLFLAMLLSMHMFWSIAEFYLSNSATSKEHDAILRLLGAIVSTISLAVLMSYVPVHFRYFPSRSPPSETEYDVSEEEDRTEVSVLSEAKFSPEYQPLGPIAPHNYAVPYQMSGPYQNSDDDSYI